MKPDILQLRDLPPAIEAALAETYAVHRPGAEDFAALAPRIRAVVTDGHRGLPAEILTALPALELVASFGVGYDAIDLAACRARGVRVSNTPDVLSDAVAELALGLMLALCRRIPAADALVRSGAWPRGGFGPTGQLAGSRAGILGLGRIGKAIAARLAACRVEICYHGRQAQADQPWRYFADLTAMARAVDWLVVAAPGSAATSGLVSRAVLEALGPEAALVNISRGTLVDEPALVELLVSGGLGGAALDVFAEEPLVPEALFALPNVVLSPHQGSATRATRDAMGALVLDNLAAHFAGRPLPTPVA